MRHQFYADRNDVWKWTVVLNAAGPAGGGRSVFWVVMLCADEPRRNYGNQRTPVLGARRDVVQFFEAERRAIDAGTPKNIHRTLPLIQGWDPVLFDTHFNDGGRQAYFNDVAGTLAARPKKRRDVVLVDPDTGMQPQNPNEKHVCWDELTQVWGAMCPGDAMVVYQHLVRNAHAHAHAPQIAAKRAALAGALGVPAGSVAVYGDGQVRFYCVDR